MESGESIRIYIEYKKLVDGLDQIDEDTLVIGSSDHKIHLLKISSGETLRTIDVGDYVFSVKSLPNSKWHLSQFFSVLTLYETFKFT